MKKGKKHAELGWESPAGVKYVFKVDHFLLGDLCSHFQLNTPQRVKFGCVEGDMRKYKVFTISNPVGSSKV